MRWTRASSLLLMSLLVTNPARGDEIRGGGDAVPLESRLNLGPEVDAARAGDFAIRWAHLPGAVRAVADQTGGSVGDVIADRAGRSPIRRS